MKNYLWIWLHFCIYKRNKNLFNGLFLPKGIFKKGIFFNELYFQNLISCSLTFFSNSLKLTDTYPNLYLPLFQLYQMWFIGNSQLIKSNTLFDGYISTLKNTLSHFRKRYSLKNFFMIINRIALCFPYLDNK